MVTETQIENFVSANVPAKKPFLRKLFTQYLKSMIYNSNISYVFSWKSLEPFGLSGQDFRGFDQRVRLSKDVIQLSDLIAISRGARNIDFYRYVASRFFPNTDVFVLTGGINYPRALRTDDVQSSGLPFYTDPTPTNTTDAGLIPSGGTVPAIYPDTTKSFWVPGQSTGLVGLLRALPGDLAITLDVAGNPIANTGMYTLTALPPTKLANWVTLVSQGAAPYTPVMRTTQTTPAGLTSLGTANVGDMAVVASLGEVASAAAQRLVTVVNATTIVAGNVYTIVTVGTTNYMAVGASANTVGLQFLATGTPGGDGKVQTAKVGDTVYRTDSTVGSGGITQGLATYKLIALPVSVDASWAITSTIRYGLVQLPKTTLANWRPINLPVNDQANGYPTTNYVSGGANPPVVIMQIPYVLSDRTTFAGSFTEFKLSLAVIKQARTFILLYPRWEVTIDEIVSGMQGSIAAFSTVFYTQSTTTFTIDTNPIKHVDQDWLDGTVIDATATGLISGTTYTVVTSLGYGASTDFTTLGSASNIPGTVFVSNTTGIVAGGGTVRTRVTNNVISLDRAPLTLEGCFVFTSAHVHTTSPLHGGAPGLPVTYDQAVTVTEISSSPLTVAWDVPIDSLTTQVEIYQLGAGGTAVSTLINFMITTAYAVPSLTVDGQQLIRIKYTFPGT